MRHPFSALESYARGRGMGAYLLYAAGVMALVVGVPLVVLGIPLRIIAFLALTLATGVGLLVLERGTT